MAEKVIGRKSLDAMGDAFGKMLEAFTDPRNIKNLTSDQINDVLERLPAVTQEFNKFKTIRQKQSDGGKKGCEIRYDL